MCRRPGGQTGQPHQVRPGLPASSSFRRPASQSLWCARAMRLKHTPATLRLLAALGGGRPAPIGITVAETTLHERSPLRSHQSKEMWACRDGNRKPRAAPPRRSGGSLLPVGLPRRTSVCVSSASGCAGLLGTHLVLQSRPAPVQRVAGSRRAAVRGGPRSRQLSGHHLGAEVSPGGEPGQRLPSLSPESAKPDATSWQTVERAAHRWRHRRESGLGAWLGRCHAGSIAVDHPLVALQPPAAR